MSMLSFDQRDSKLVNYGYYDNAFKDTCMSCADYAVP